MNSLITVIVPVADTHRHLLPRAIYSLKQQTYRSEILIVNDSETSLLMGGVSIVETGGNKGTAYARNLALDHVKTPLVFFLDADDYLLNTALETLLNAYLTYDTCYVYSDWIQYGKNGEYSKHESKIYNRIRLLRHSIHLVNILLETDVAKSVYYDINYRGWEDWEFHIRLAVKGYCGTRVPEPLVIYDMTTSINREKHNAIENEVYQEILDKYEPYMEGEVEFMPCQTCGGNKPKMPNPVVTPPDDRDGFTTMEYLGRNTGPIGYRIGGVVYKGANDDAFKYIQVPNQAVAEMINRGLWRRVVKSAQPAVLPKQEEFNQWREMNKTEVPKDWTTLFAKNAIVVGPNVSSEVTQTITPKKRGRPKGQKNRVKELANAN